MKNQTEIQMNTNQFILDKISTKEYNVFLHTAHTFVNSTFIKHPQMILICLYHLLSTVMDCYVITDSIIGTRRGPMQL